MTTIVFTDSQVASDMQMTNSYKVLSNSYHKIQETPEYIVAGAGSVTQIMLAIEYILAKLYTGEAGELPEIPEGLIKAADEIDYEVAILDKETKQLYIAEPPSLHLLEVDKPFAMGSGQDIALGYLLGRANKGKDLAKGAVKAASVYDVYTGGKVHVIDY